MIKGLPYDAEVEYLESTGTQWIDTGVRLKYSDVVNCEVMLNDNRSIFGYLDSGQNFCVTTSGSIIYAYYVDYTRFGSKQITTGSIFNIELGNGSFYYNGNLLGKKTYADETLLNGACYLFGRNASGSIDDALLGRIYSFSITRNNAKILDFIPVRVGTVGYMYDRVTRKLFGNSGTGAFVLGPDVAKPVMGLHFYGMWRSARAYVQDGLIAMWDGIENAGWGVHADLSDTWMDLVGGYNLTNASQISFIDGCIDGQTTDFSFHRSGRIDAISAALLDYQTITVECVTSPAIPPAANNMSIINVYYHGLWLYQFSESIYAQCFWQSGLAGTPKNSISAVYDKVSMRLYQDGQYVRDIGVSKTDEYTESEGVTIGGYQYRSANCKYYSFRIYSRALTAAEIAHNYLVDRVRFNLPEVMA